MTASVIPFIPLSLHFRQHGVQAAIAPLDPLAMTLDPGVHQVENLGL
jgi:hypothetical protein